jgi:hypothetical protein
MGAGYGFDFSWLWRKVSVWKESQNSGSQDTSVEERFATFSSTKIRLLVIVFLVAVVVAEGKVESYPK